MTPRPPGDTPRTTESDAARAEAHDATHRAHAAARRVLDAAVARCRPGVTLSTVRAAAAHDAAALGCQPAFVLPASESDAAVAPSTPRDVLWIGLNDVLLPADAPGLGDNGVDDHHHADITREATHTPSPCARVPDAILRPGDVATLDVALRLDGWAADIAVAIAIEPATEDARALVAAARAITGAGVRAAQWGGDTAKVDAAVRDEAARLDVRTVPGLMGHHIGRSAHADAARDEAASPPSRGQGPSLGQVAAMTVEPIVTRSATPRTQAIGGVLVLHDGAAAACFEEMVWIRFGE